MRVAKDRLVDAIATLLLSVRNVKPKRRFRNAIDLILIRRGVSFVPPNRRYPPNFDLFEIAIKELGHMTGECASVLKQRSITRVGVNDELGIGQMTSKEKIYG